MNNLEKTASPIIDINNLVVEYGKGKSKIRAVDGISFTINQGEMVGFIGPNGAGKTSTIKVIMGFIFPTSGEVKVFGAPAGTVESRWRIGYLPEVALYYSFMKARELLELYGGLHGLSRECLKKRIPEILETVGLEGKGGILLKNFSKGMQQRLGIAQAIIADPEALIFDELSSGLDPIGRYDLRKALINLKERGRTIFFSSHELTEVENLCNRVIVIHKGKIKCQSTIDELLKPLNVFEIEFFPSTPLKNRIAELKALCDLTQNNEIWSCRVEGAEKYVAVLNLLTEEGAAIKNTFSKRQSLEDFFMQLIKK